ncbi:MAG: outer membrane beta-barrel protein [Paracoccaceae bacterium]
MQNRLALAILAATALPAAAQDWNVQVTPYVWASGMGGSVTPFSGAPTLSFDKSFSDVMEDVDGAFFLSGYARRDRLVFLGDLSWSSSSKDGLVPPGLPAEAKLTQRSMTLAAGYRAVQTGDMTLDLLAGARAWRIKADVSVAGGAMSASPTESFVDPIIAARANFALAPRWSAIFYFDVGGFGVGSDSTFQVLATANYQVNDNLFVSAGYRRLDVDYSSGGTHLGVTMAGPLFGVTWKF